MTPADPELLPPLAPAEVPYRRPTRVRGPHTIPNLAHTLLFGVLVLIAALLTGFALSGVLQSVPAFRHESLVQLQTDPRAVIPLEVAMYAVALGLAFVLFPLIWRRPFLQALRWNSRTLRRWIAYLAGVGIFVSLGVQYLSNYLPIPKSLPIDKFFQNPVGVWIVAIFGITIAPFFEELAFRGFLLPSLASAWDSIARYAASRPTVFTEQLSEVSEHAAEVIATPPGDPAWSPAALIFASLLTSIGFALIHGAQLAHSYAPLAVLFCVSLVLCIVRLRTHSLAASTFVHATYNATIFLLLFIGTSGFRHLDKLNN